MGKLYWCKGEELSKADFRAFVRAALGAALNYGKGGFSGGRESRPYMEPPKHKKNCGPVLQVDWLYGRLYLVI